MAEEDTLWAAILGCYSVPPHKTDYIEDGEEFGKLGQDEHVMFYQETNYASSFPFLIKNEVLVTNGEVRIAEKVYLRWCLKRPFSQRQTCMDKALVRGYDSGTLHPKLRDLLIGLLIIAVSIWLLCGTAESTARIIRWLIEAPAHVITWLGGPCKSLGLCSRVEGRYLVSGSSLVTQDIAQPEQISPYSLLEDVHHAPVIRNSKWHARQSQLGAAVGQAMSGLQPSDNEELAAQPAAPTVGCHDLTQWIDHEGNNCTMYANPARPLACSNVEHSSAGLSSLASRHDNQASRTSPLDACCSCGGSEHTGRGNTVRHLAQLLDYQFQTITAPTVDQDSTTAIALEATQYGADVHVRRLESMSTAGIMTFGRRLSMSTPVVDGSLTQDYASLLQTLYPDMASVHSAAGITLSPEQVEEVSETDDPSRLERFGEWMLHLVGCIFHIFTIVFPLYGLYGLFIWTSLYCNPRAFVVLRFQKHFIGQASKVSDRELWMHQYTGLKHLKGLEGFLMPADLQRMAEFGRSLELSSKEVAVKDNAEGELLMQAAIQKTNTGKD